MTRKPGGQPANTNALKHGYFSKYFSKDEIADLEAALSDKLTDEIALVRVIVRRLFKITGEETDPQKLSASVSTLSLVLDRLAHMLRTQHLLSKDSGVSSLDVLSQALKEVSDELKLK